MDQFLYKCHYCGKEYEPRRRHKQKYCSNSCRVTAFKLKKKIDVPVINKEAPQDQNVKKESMSLAGIGNATAGNVLYDMIKNFLTSEENKSASNGQAKEIIKLLTELKERHHLITNIPSREDGAQPYFDMQTRELVYRLPFPKLKLPPLPSNSIFR